jgi:hypothetical protein
MDKIVHIQVSEITETGGGAIADKRRIEFGRAHYIMPDMPKYSWNEVRDNAVAFSRKWAEPCQN